MEKIEIQFTLFSAFYTPLIATMAGGFLKEEGIDASWSVATPGVSAIKALEDGTAQVIQTAPSQAFNSLDNGEVPRALHFAQINEMDGFFLTAREPDRDFSWAKLEGAEVVLFDGGQPLAMFQYACHKAGIDFSKIKNELEKMLIREKRMDIFKKCLIFLDTRVELDQNGFKFDIFEH